MARSISGCFKNVARASCPWTGPRQHEQHEQHGQKHERDAHATVLKQALNQRGLGRNGGSILILVVACLVLLAVMGTAYIVMARSDRTSTRGNNSSVNTDLATQAILNSVRATLMAPTMDGLGEIYTGYPTYTGYPATFTGTKSRSWTYGEKGTTFGQTNYDSSVPDEAYLSSGNNPYSLLTAMRYDVNAGTFDLPYPGAADVNVVANPGSAANDAFLNLLSVSAADPVRVRYGLVIKELSQCANLNAGNYNSTMSDPEGQTLAGYLLYSPALLAGGDTAQNIQQNGSPLGRGAGALPASGGPPTYSLAAWHNIMLTYENPQLPLGTSPQTWAASGVQLFDVTDEIALRAFGGNPPASQYASRPQFLWPNSLAYSANRNLFTTYSWDRMNYRGVYAALDAGTTAPFKAETSGGVDTAVWPVYPAKVLANPNVAATDSNQWAYDIATAATNMANALINAGYTGTEARQFAINYASYLCNGGSFSTINSVNAYRLPAGLCYLANDGFHLRTNVGQGVITAANTAVHVASTAGSDLQAETNRTYFGFAAQPYLNEIAAVVTPGPPPTYGEEAVEIINPTCQPLSLADYQLWVVKKATGAIVTTFDFSTQTPEKVIPAWNVTATSRPLVVVANGTLSTLTVSATTGVTPIAATAATFEMNGGDELVLARLYYDDAGTKHYAPVDIMEYTTRFTYVTAGGTKASIQRFNSDTETPPFNYAWLCTSSNMPAAYSTAPTLGDFNDHTPANFIGAGGVALTAVTAPLTFPWYDRFEEPNPENVTPGRSVPLFNIAELAKIARVGNLVDTTTTPPTWNVIADTVQAANTSFATVGEEKVESVFHLDFSAFAPGAAVPTTFGNAYDPNAQKILDTVAMIDRASDKTIDMGGGPTDVNKVRLPGRINVNTASAAVLRAVNDITTTTAWTNPHFYQPGDLVTYSGSTYRCEIAHLAETLLAPGTDAHYWTLLNPYYNPYDQIVTNTISYRDRVSQTINSVPFPGAPALPAAAAGLGIRNMGEFLTASAWGRNFTCLFGRDVYWGRMYNRATVRSDAFAVYGYLEAVRPNPNYTAGPAFDNKNDWYVTGSPLVADDATSAGTTAKLIRVARHRFIAIIDRSFSNTPHATLAGTAFPAFELPRVVAFKDLGN